MKLVPWDLPQIQTLVEPLRSDTQALWGNMTAETMLRHLVDIARISNGKLKVDFANKEENLPKLRHILYKDVPFPREFRAPEQVEAFIESRNTCDFQSLKHQLIEELMDMESHFSEDHRTVINAVFGPLSKEDWVWFHRKHMSHHFAQFGLWQYA